MAKAIVCCCGIGLILAALWLLASCLFYKTFDAGYNIVSSASVQNLMGAGGAVAADFVLTWGGISLPIFLIAWLIWGYEIIRYRVFINSFGRIIACGLGCFCFSVFLCLSFGNIDGFKIGGNIGSFFSSQFLTLANRLYSFAYHKILLIVLMFILTFVSFNY